MNKYFTVGAIAVIALAMIGTSLTQSVVGIRGAEGARLVVAAPPSNHR
jgi:hypothetical protein